MSPYKIRQLTVSALATLLLASPLTGGAQETNFGSRVPTTQELIDTLTPKSSMQQRKTRGIVFKNQPQQDNASDAKAAPASTQEAQQASAQPSAQQAQAETKAAPVEPAPEQSQEAASMQILFEFDSDVLTATAVKQLHPLGMALKSTELSGLTFMLEGHTDAVGSSAYNMDLSERRAKAIKRHLTENYQLPAESLVTIGVGESSLLVPEQPDAPENRRVRIVGVNN